MYACMYVCEYVCEIDRFVLSSSAEEDLYELFVSMHVCMCVCMHVKLIGLCRIVALKKTCTSYL